MADINWGTLAATQQNKPFYDDSLDGENPIISLMNRTPSGASMQPPGTTSDSLSGPEDPSKNVYQLIKEAQAADAARLAPIQKQLLASSAADQKHYADEQAKNDFLKIQALNSFHPQVDLSPALAFFADWTGDKSGLQAYKRPESYMDSAAKVEKLFPDVYSQAQQARNENLKTQLSTAIAQNKDPMLTALVKLQGQKAKPDPTSLITDFKPQPGVKLSEKQVEDFIKTQEAHDTGSAAISRMKDLLNTYGASGIDPRTPEAGEMKNLANSIQLGMRESKNLNRMATVEYQAFQDIAQDPTKVSTWAGNLLDKTKLIGALNSLQNESDAKLASQAKRHRLDPINKMSTGYLDQSPAPLTNSSSGLTGADLLKNLRSKPQ